MKVNQGLRYALKQIQSPWRVTELFVLKIAHADEDSEHAADDT